MACLVIVIAGMPYVITKKCAGVCDTACVDVCPADCIVGPIAVDELGGFPGVQLFIDPDACTDCGACVAECPVAAIYLDDDVPAEHRDDIARNVAFFVRDTTGG
jgi:NAD-dependent dihydropyrimidine dehydrogenase PreA subunit